MGKFEAVTESPAGSENRIPQAQRANGYAEVNGASGFHFAQKDTTKPFLPSSNSGLANNDPTKQRGHLWKRKER